MESQTIAHEDPPTRAALLTRKEGSVDESTAAVAE
jgi:hypothetical protein